MEQLWFTRLLNTALAGPANMLLGWFGVHPADARAPISNTFAMEVLVALILMLFALWLRGRLSVDRPKGWQQVMELAWDGIGKQAEEIGGHGALNFQNYFVTLALFILLCNLIGMIPGFETPTADKVVTVGLALVSFCIYQFVGIRKHGFGYFKQFLGPVWVVAPLMVLIESVSHLARILSLGVRLYANMLAGEMITLVFIALLPISGVVFMGLHAFVALIQTYIFMVLTMVYIGGALAEEH